MKLLIDGLNCMNVVNKFEGWGCHSYLRSSVGGAVIPI